MSDRIFVGVAWPYANGPLHVGHLAGAYLPADIFARYHRLCGNQVLMVSGSDCHGTPITLQAEREGVAPGDLVRRHHESFLATFSKLGISFDLFTQTYSENHYAVTSEFFLRLSEKGFVNKKSVTGSYSETLGRFLPDRYVEGRCTNCGFERARGDQCDNCGRVHDPENLIGPKSKLDGAPVTFRDTEHYLLDLPRLEPDIQRWLTDIDRSHWRQNALTFTQNWLSNGLKERAITRDIEWGVPVPVTEPGFEQKRLYVWFDAVIGYLSASIEWAHLGQRADQWQNWWKPGDAEREQVRSYYFIGKDNIPFHTIIWPSLLIGSGGLFLPYDVPANEFLNLEGKKMSTSEGWGLYVPDIEDRYQSDQLRYYLAANAPETRDANWSWKDFVERNNNELVAVWGNLANRTLGLAWRSFGRIPEHGILGTRRSGTSTGWRKSVPGRRVSSRKGQDPGRIAGGIGSRSPSQPVPHSTTTLEAPQERSRSSGDSPIHGATNRRPPQRDSIAILAAQQPPGREDAGPRRHLSYTGCGTGSGRLR